MMLAVKVVDAKLTMNASCRHLIVGSPVVKSHAPQAVELRGGLRHDDS